MKYPQFIGFNAIEPELITRINFRLSCPSQHIRHNVTNIVPLKAHRFLGNKIPDRLKKKLSYGTVLRTAVEMAHGLHNTEPSEGPADSDMQRRG